MKQAKKHKSRMLEKYAYEARIKMWIERWEKQMKEKHGEDWKENWKEKMSVVGDVISGCNF